MNPADTLDHLALGVNLDHVATLRQVRKAEYPDPLPAALLARDAGADAIVLHLREDRRHAQERDLFNCRGEVGLPLCMEMAATPEMVTIARRLKPDSCCLVPEKRRELTTEGGLKLTGAGRPELERTLKELKQAGIATSLFIEPDPILAEKALALGAEKVEFHTGRYAASEPQAAVRELEKLKVAVTAATRLGLEVHAGHGLNLDNLGPIAGLTGISTLNIGHAIVARAIMVGMKLAVLEFRQAMGRSRE